MLIIGTKVFGWGSALTQANMRCGTCGTVAQFVEKTAMRFFTVFFIPVIPISRKMYLVQCPKCRTRYERQ